VSLAFRIVKTESDGYRAGDLANKRIAERYRLKLNGTVDLCREVSESVINPPLSMQLSRLTRKITCNLFATIRVAKKGPHLFINLSLYEVFFVFFVT
jgi:hypothetical protein